MVGVFGMVGEKLRELGTRWSQEAGEIKTTNLKLNSENSINIEEESKVVLFFSFDVVNSTAYKSVNYFNWAQILNELFKKLRGEVENKITDAQMWRLFGDEVVFIVTVNSEDEVRKVVDTVFCILTKTRKALKDGEFINVQDFRLKQLLHLQNILSLQATAWIAVVHSIEDLENFQGSEWDDNVFEKHRTKENQIIYEFLGNDIDTGFRLSKLTRDGRLTVSFELACLIAEVTDCASYLHIITYRRLKGVWKDKLYPIIWYHNPKRVQEQYEIGNGTNLQSVFAFDDWDSDDLVKEYFENREATSQISKYPLMDKRMFTDSYYALQRIIHDRNLKGKIERIKNTLNNTTDKRKYLEDQVWLQMHCVAVCFREENNTVKILIAKRGEKRAKFPGLWEFGCAKATLTDTIAERIKKEYKEDFNINIEPVVNKNRGDIEPIPLALYQIPDENNRTHKGIITLARIIDDFSVDNFKKTTKHDQLKWITENELENIDEKKMDCVADFKETLEMAFDWIRLHKEDGKNE